MNGLNRWLRWFGGTGLQFRPKHTIAAAMPSGLRLVVIRTVPKLLFDPLDGLAGALPSVALQRPGEPTLCGVALLAGPALDLA